MELKLKRIIGFFLLISAMCLSALDNVDSTQYSNKKIKDIQITGLKRTKTSVVYNLLEVETSSDFSDFKEYEFIQSCLKTGIFGEPSIKYELVDDEVIIRIDMIEKWSFIPAPILSVESDNQTYGAVLIESNFLGLKKILVIDGSYSTKNGINSSFSFKDEIFPGRFSYLLQGGIKNNTETDYYDFDKVDIGTYSSFSLYSNAVGYLNLSKDFSLSLVTFYSFFEIEPNTDFDVIFNGENHFLEEGIMLSVDKLTYTNTISTGLYSESLYTIGMDITNDDIYHTFNSKTSYTLSPLENLYFRTGYSVSLFDKPYLKQYDWGSMDYSRTIPAQTHDIHYSGDVQVEYSAFNFSWGSISLKALFEAGVYNRDDSEYESYYGPATGFRMYLKGVAIPAMGFDLGYNLTDSTPNFSFTMGIAM